MQFLFTHAFLSYITSPHLHLFFHHAFLFTHTFLFPHTQEAVAVGMLAALEPKDSIITAYRCHGWAYCMGWTPKAILAELFGVLGRVITLSLSLSLSFFLFISICIYYTVYLLMFVYRRIYVCVCVFGQIYIASSS